MQLRIDHRQRVCLKFEASMVWLAFTGSLFEISVELAHQLWIL
jgi:hypothetical protein